MATDAGRSASRRATHEPSPKGLGHSVSVPNAMAVALEHELAAINEDIRWAEAGELGRLIERRDCIEVALSAGKEKQHWSDCATHNDPPSDCDCTGYTESDQIAALGAECGRLRFGLRYWRDQYIGLSVELVLIADTLRTIEASARGSGTLARDRDADTLRAIELFAANAAQGIEAQRAETENTGSVADESPVAESDAPNPNHHPTRKG